MGELILESKSWQKGGDSEREKNLESVVKGAGYEVEKPEAEELPAPPAELNESLTLPESFEKSREAYISQIEEAKKVHGDWEDLRKKFEANDVHIGEAVQQAIIEQSNGTEVTYYLMRNPDYAKKLGRMCKAGRGVSAVREIENLSAKLGGNTTHAKYTPRTSATPRKRPPENASFEEIVKAPAYWGKARDIRRALSRR